VGSVAARVREHLCEVMVRAWPYPASWHPEHGTVSLDNELPRGGLGMDLVQITPTRWLPKSVLLMLRVARTEGPTYSHRDLTAATVKIQLLKPEREITVDGGTLASGERDDRGRREEVHDLTVALALRSLMDHMVPCEQHGWRVDTPWPWQPEPIRPSDQALKRVKQRMRSDWPSQTCAYSEPLSWRPRHGTDGRPRREPWPRHCSFLSARLTT
jgi:hypothetical protein